MLHSFIKSKTVAGSICWYRPGGARLTTGSPAEKKCEQSLFLRVFLLLLFCLPVLPVLLFESIEDGVTLFYTVWICVAFS